MMTGDILVCVQIRLLFDSHCFLKMDFITEKKNCILVITEKYKFFSASNLFFKDIYSKLREINTDLTAAHSIRKYLILNWGRNEKVNTMLLLAHRTINDLEATLAAVDHRLARLEEIKNALILEDEDDIDEILRAMFYV